MRPTPKEGSGRPPGQLPPSALNLQTWMKEVVDSTCSWWPAAEPRRHVIGLTPTGLGHPGHGCPLIPPGVPWAGVSVCSQLSCTPPFSQYSWGVCGCRPPRSLSPRSPHGDILEPLGKVMSQQVTVSPRILGGHRAGASLGKGHQQRGSVLEDGGRGLQGGVCCFPGPAP